MIFPRPSDRIGLPDEARPYLGERDAELNWALEQIPRLIGRQVDDGAARSVSITVAAYQVLDAAVWGINFEAPMSGRVVVKLGFFYKGDMAAGVYDIYSGLVVRGAAIETAASGDRRLLEFQVAGLTPNENHKWGVMLRSRVAGASATMSWGGGDWGGTPGSERGPGVFELWDYPDPVT